MQLTLTLPNKQNFFKILLLIIVTAIIFAVSNLLTVNQIHKNTSLNIESAKDVAEEIFNSGSTEALAGLSINSTLISKLEEELAHILAKTTDKQGCEVYFLVASINSQYPVLGYGDLVLGFEYLYAGEVWKIGQTCNGEELRYPSDIYYKNLNNTIKITNRMIRYQRIFVGSQKECLILEKVLIYTYPIWSGHKDLIKPPGCKIFR